MTDQIFEEPLPEWAASTTEGNYMAPDAQLRTRDGRRIGNARVERTYYYGKLKGAVVDIVTDAGTSVKALLLAEVTELFYPPKYIMKPVTELIKDTDQVRRDYNDAISFALQDEDGILFLSTWNEGDWESLRKEWPDFKLPSIVV